MTAKKLRNYGMKPVALVRLEGRKLVIKVTDARACELDKCVYVFLIGNEIARIGSSKAPLKSRLKGYARDVTKGLRGLKSSTTKKEAKLWHDKLTRHRHGTIYARRGAIVKTRIGKFPAYLDEESILIGRHFHPGILNRNKHR